jgi:hypothetical protein
MGGAPFSKKRGGPFHCADLATGADSARFLAAWRLIAGHEVPSAAAPQPKLASALASKSTVAICSPFETARSPLKNSSRKNRVKQ